MGGAPAGPDTATAPSEIPAGYVPTSIVCTTSSVRVSIFTTVPTSALFSTRRVGV